MTISLKTLYRLKGIKCVTPNPNRIPPYNTGKVKIGCHYVPPQLNYNTETTDFWQAVYSGEHAARRRERFWMAAYVAAVVIGGSVGYWYYLTY